MNKYLLRVVSLLLVPCLIGDPVTAAAFQRVQITNHPNTALPTSLFTRQAMVPRARWVHSLSGWTTTAGRRLLLSVTRRPTVVHRLEQPGSIIGILPAGRPFDSLDEEIKAWKDGVARIARLANVPVIPAAISVRGAFPAFDVSFGAPISSVEDPGGTKSSEALLDEIKASIRSLTSGPQPNRAQTATSPDEEPPDASILGSKWAGVAPIFEWVYALPFIGTLMHIIGLKEGTPVQEIRHLMLSLIAGFIFLEGLTLPIPSWLELLNLALWATVSGHFFGANHSWATARQKTWLSWAGTLFTLATWAPLYYQGFALSIRVPHLTAWMMTGMGLPANAPGAQLFVLMTLGTALNAAAHWTHFILKRLGAFPVWAPDASIKQSGPAPHEQPSDATELQARRAQAKIAQVRRIIQGMISEAQKNLGETQRVLRYERAHQERPQDARASRPSLFDNLSEKVSPADEAGIPTPEQVLMGARNKARTRLDYLRRIMIKSQEVGLRTDDLASFVEKTLRNRTKAGSELQGDPRVITALTILKSASSKASTPVPEASKKPGKERSMRGRAAAPSKRPSVGWVGSRQIEGRIAHADVLMQQHQYGEALKIWETLVDVLDEFEPLYEELRRVRPGNPIPPALAARLQTFQDRYGEDTNLNEGTYPRYYSYIREQYQMADSAHLTFKGDYFSVLRRVLHEIIRKHGIRLVAIPAVGRKFPIDPNALTASFFGLPNPFGVLSYIAQGVWVGWNGFVVRIRQVKSSRNQTLLSTAA